MTIQLTEHPEQQKLVQALLGGVKKRIAVAAARRCGKSEIIARTMVSIAACSAANILIYSPTLTQTKQIYLPKFEDILSNPKIGILLQRFNKSDYEFRFRSGGRILLGSAENLPRREGVDWHYIVCDEASDIPPDRLPIDSGLLPALGRTHGVAAIIGVPKAAAVGGARFKDLFFKWKDETETDSFYAAYGWSADGIIEQNVIEHAREVMLPREFKEHYGGVFTEIQGEVYYAFKEDNIVHNTEFNDDDIIYVATDWNVNPMAWVLFQERVVSDEWLVASKERESLTTSHKSLATYVAVDQLYIRNTNTYECCDILKKRLAGRRNPLVFLGDATGHSRKTSSIASDIHIIRQQFPFDTLAYQKANPSVDLRIASVNNALLRKRLFIDERCTELIKDLESTSYKPGTLDIDARNPDRIHSSDACGYFVYAKMPIQRDNPIQETVGGVYVHKKEGRREEERRGGVASGVQNVSKPASMPFSISVKRGK